MLVAGAALVASSKTVAALPGRKITAANQKLGLISDEKLLQQTGIVHAREADRGASRKVGAHLLSPTPKQEYKPILGLASLSNLIILLIPSLPADCVLLLLQANQLQCRLVKNSQWKREFENLNENLAKLEEITCSTFASKIEQGQAAKTSSSENKFANST